MLSRKLPSDGFRKGRWCSLQCSSKNIIHTQLIYRNRQSIYLGSHLVDSKKETLDIGKATSSFCLSHSINLINR